MARVQGWQTLRSLLGSFDNFLTPGYGAAAQGALTAIVTRAFGG